MNHCILIDDGQARARIVLEKASYELALEAMHELRTGIAQASGVRLPMDSRKMLSFHLEAQVDTPVTLRFSLVPPSAGLGKDGFRLAVVADNVEFAAETQSGFRQAVYDFLRRFCGFEWLWPGPDGEVYDCIETLAVPIGSYSRQPAYAWRHFSGGRTPTGGRAEVESKYNLAEFHMDNDMVSDSLYGQWCERAGMGGLKVFGVHMWSELLNPLQWIEQHPEYFAEVNGDRMESLRNFTGKHGGQLCTTNPEVIAIIVQGVRRFFDEHPDHDVVGISPNDGGGFCECDECIALDVACGNAPPQLDGAGDELNSTFRDDADATDKKRQRIVRITGPITDRMFTYANAVAEKIAESHPDKKLMLLVYSCYRQPPRQVKLYPNVIAQYCVQCHQHWDPVCRDSDYEAIQHLSHSSHEMSAYEYYDQGAWPGVPRLFPDLIADSVKKFHQQGMRHYFVQASTGFAVQGFNFWFLARLLWDPTCDVDESLARYCLKGFAAAATDMQAYFNLWRMRWREYRGLSGLGDAVPGSQTEVEQVMPFDQLCRLYPPEFLERCQQSLETARLQVPAESPERRRIDFVARGLEATWVAVNAATPFYRLVHEEYWPMKAGDVTAERVSSLGEPDEIRRKCREILAGFARWEAFLESVRNDFVLSHKWARYCYDSRKGLHPHYTVLTILSVLPD